MAQTAKPESVADDGTRSSQQTTATTNVAKDNAQIGKAPTDTLPADDLPPVDDAQFVTEELPADFWDSAPVTPAEPPLASYDGAAPDIDSQPDTQVQASAAGNSSDTPGPGSSSQTKPGNAPLVDNPLFSELQSLFPGRIVRIEPHEPELAPDNLDATEDILNPDLDELAEDALGEDAA